MVRREVVAVSEENDPENDAEDYDHRKAYYTHEGLRNTTRGDGATNI